MQNTRLIIALSLTCSLTILSGGGIIFTAFINDFQGWYQGVLMAYGMATLMCAYTQADVLIRGNYNVAKVLAIGQYVLYMFLLIIPTIAYEIMGGSIPELLLLLAAVQNLLLSLFTVLTCAVK